MELKLDMSNYSEYMTSLKVKYANELEQLDIYIFENRDSSYLYRYGIPVKSSVLESVFGKNYNNDKDLMFLLITESYSCLKDCSDELKNNKEFISKLALSNGIDLDDASDEILNDSEFLKELIENAIGPYYEDFRGCFSYRTSPKTELFEKLLHEHTQNNRKNGTSEENQAEMSYELQEYKSSIHEYINICEEQDRIKRNSDIDMFCKKLARIWKENCSEWRFGQLMVNVLNSLPQDPFFYQDIDILQELENFFKSEEDNINRTVEKNGNI